MDNRNDILNELKALSPLIAGMEKLNVFTVPDGYFEMLDEHILLNVKAETGVLLSSTTNQSLMQVPQGYFESLADNILKEIKAQDNAATELDELSPMLSSVQNKNPFTVPQDYFENLAKTVLNKIHNPQDSAAELEKLSPMLHSIQSTNVFTVPPGYFESLSGNILDAVKPQHAKLVTMHRRTTTILKYAVAAVFTGMMALGVYKYTMPANPAVNALPEYVAAGQKINNVDEELAKVNDEDIIKYLQANGSDVDAALVANTIDEKELPTQEDYLTDDKALDKYLDNIDLNDLKN